LLGVVSGSEGLDEAQLRLMSTGLVFGFYAGLELGIRVIDSGLRSDLLEIEAGLRGRDPMEPALAHEVCHALQDQHFGLERWMREARSTDARLARQALVEGAPHHTSLTAHFRLSRLTSHGSRSTAALLLCAVCEHSTARVALARGKRMSKLCQAPFRLAGSGIARFVPGDNVVQTTFSRRQLQ
jgi:hypothetical protein